MEHDQRSGRSRNMAAIGSKDTRPELVVRRHLHRVGLRYRLHVKGMSGTPDLVLPKWKAVVLVHGCFWHRHPRCAYSTTPKTRTDFWLAKFEANTKRDALQIKALEEHGWRVLVIWECETDDSAKLEALVREIKMCAS